jgi:hypothetical protein
MYLSQQVCFNNDKPPGSQSKPKSNTMMTPLAHATKYDNDSLLEVSYSNYIKFVE